MLQYIKKCTVWLLGQNMPVLSACMFLYLYWEFGIHSCYIVGTGRISTWCLYAITHVIGIKAFFINNYIILETVYIHSIRFFFVFNLTARKLKED